MPRTRKRVSSLNLFKYDVLIEDTAPRSEYFKISQFDGYFYGGRNGFLIAGAGVLQPSSNILIEILDSNKNTIFSSPVKNYIEGNSRLIKIEVYENTPPGVGKLVILGCANTYLNGNPIPSNWKNKYNIRWSTDVIISPKADNITPIRFTTPPELYVEEKFYTPPTSASFITQSFLADIQLTPLNFNVIHSGYLIKVLGPPNARFTSDMVGGNIVGEVSISKDDVGPLGILQYRDTENRPLQISRILNSTTAQTKGQVIPFNNTIITSAYFTSSTAPHYPVLQPIGQVTASGTTSINYSVVTQSIQTNVSASFAKIRIVNLDTLSGKVEKIRLSYKATTEPGDYIVLGDVPTQTTNLLSVDTNNAIIDSGKFKNIVISNYWYKDNLNISRFDTLIAIPHSYYTSSIAPTSVFKPPTQTVLLDALDATPSVSESGVYVNSNAYFFGTLETNNIELYNGNEYTLSFNALVSKQTGSYTLTQSDYAVEIYLVESSGSNLTGGLLHRTDPRGQLIGTIIPEQSFITQNFETLTFNFTPVIGTTERARKFGLRFIVYGGVWEFANITVRLAQDTYFNPIETNFIIENTNFTNRLLTYRAQYLDINNNSTNVISYSTPTYFSGSTAIL